MKVSLDRYIVTPNGEIYDKQKENTPVKTFKSNKYIQCCIYDENGKHVMGVHNVVAQVYCSDWFEGCVVHHKDNNQHNNNVDNLECLRVEDHTRKHTQIYFDIIKICPYCKKEFIWNHTSQSRFYKKKKIGEPYCSKECWENDPQNLYNLHGKTIMCIETNTIYKSCALASLMLNISYSSLTQHLHGKLKSAQGYHFVFI